MIPLAEAQDIAVDLRALLAFGCQRIEIAGSVRRRRPEVKDIELVALPLIESGDEDLWGEPMAMVDRFEERIGALLADGTIAPRQMEVHRADGRTGPKEWSERLVTDCQRYMRRVQDGQLLHLGRPVPCPEESDFFVALGQPWVEPWDRETARVSLDPKAMVAAP